MASKFNKNYPAHLVMTRRNEREQVLMFAAAGLMMFLLFVLVVVFNFKNSADAKQDIAQAVPVPQTPLVGTVTLYALEHPIRAGMPLSSAKFKEVYWPRNTIPGQAIRDKNELAGKFAKADISANVPIQRDNLADQPLLVSLPLTPGNRAVTISVDAVSGIEGHALPGTRVDVVLTYREEGRLTSKVIVQNARVLSLGGDKTPVNKRALDRARKAERTITLDVTPKDALTIQTAKELGRLSLLMRSPDDDRGTPVPEVNSGDISPRSKVKKRDTGCRAGRMRIDGKEYVVGCNGNLHQVDAYEP